MVGQAVTLIKPALLDLFPTQVKEQNIDVTPETFIQINAEKRSSKWMSLLWLDSFHWCQRRTTICQCEGW
jgi:hypothetical protein